MTVPLNLDGSVTVAGFCPMGCGKTLHIRWRGIVECRAKDCPRPDAVTVILADPETEHLVVVGEFGYTIQHPLRERVHGALFECSVHADVSDTVDMYVGKPGKYRVTWTEDRELKWEFLGDADAPT